MSKIFGEAPCLSKYAAHCAEPKCAQTCNKVPPACLNPEIKHFFIFKLDFLNKELIKSNYKKQKKNKKYILMNQAELEQEQ